VLSLRSVWIIPFACLASAVAVGTVGEDAGASGVPPAVSLSPSGNFTDGQTISVSVGSNSYFTPHAGVNILECADRGGLAANLPTDISACDGSTIQGTTVLVANDGSFSESSYQVYALPSSTLGEQANDKPICNQTNYCVLYVGQNQNDFTAAKAFSAPFLITPGAASAAAAPAAAPAVGSSSSSSSNTSSTSAASATADHSSSSVNTASSLADTGPSTELTWLLGSGGALFCIGAIGRRRALRGIR
jgi:hypothetical protein